MNTFSIRGSLTFGWETFKKRPLFLVAVQILAMYVPQIAAIPMQYLVFLIALIAPVTSQGIAAVLFFLVVLAGVVGLVGFSFLVQIAQMNIFLKAGRSIDAVQLEDAYVPEHFWRFVGAMLLSVLGILCGLILLVIPGIILMVGWMFAALLVIDKRMSPVQALGESWKMTKGNRFKLFGFMLAAMLLNIGGMIAFFVGIFVTAPVTMLAMVHIYDRLQSRA
jgi:uncharacterized membrane protein